MTANKNVNLMLVLWGLLYLSDDSVEGFGSQHRHVLSDVLDEGPAGRHVLRHCDFLDFPVTAEDFRQHLLKVGSSQM